eukprot:Pompholyxophrys_sp_v1_NODE_68_length_2521_cov_1.980130.p3 type:complete len:127 gc:universal NODE_68_length_2521_cov_1.980130:2160-1780(-)
MATPSSSTPVSILESLKAPTPSENARKRVIKNAVRSEKSTKRYRPPVTTNDPASVTPRQRAKQYGTDGFLVSGGMLFCDWCREEVSLRKSTIDNHIKTKKHLDGKDKAEKGTKRSLDLAKLFQVVI